MNATLAFSPVDSPAMTYLVPPPPARSRATHRRRAMRCIECATSSSNERLFWWLRVLCRGRTLGGSPGTRRVT